MLFAAAKVANAQESLRVGYFDLTPHVVQVEGKEPSGAAVGYFEEFIAPVLGIEIIWDKEVTPPTRLMDQLRTGEKDAMIFLGWTKDRTAYLHYPDPYLTLPEVMVFRADHPIGQVVTVEDLHGLRVGFLVGGRIPEALQDPRITYDLIAGKRLFERNLEKLLLGRIDAEEIKLLPIEFLPPVDIYTVFSKLTVGEDLVARYNEALRAGLKRVSYLDYVDQYQSSHEED
jgi:ABC-type amino acid transport substrate-binding protein